ncbi:15178_t:CDS:2, partial [Funneliformis geosporum]
MKRLKAKGSINQKELLFIFYDVIQILCQSSNIQTLQESNLKRRKIKELNVEESVSNVDELEENVNVVEYNDIPKLVFGEKYDDQLALDKDDLLFKNPNPSIISKFSTPISPALQNMNNVQLNISTNQATSEMLAILVDETKIMFLRACDPPPKEVAPRFADATRAYTEDYINNNRITLDEVPSIDDLGSYVDDMVIFQCLKIQWHRLMKN